MMRSSAPKCLAGAFRSLSLASTATVRPSIIGATIGPTSQYRQVQQPQKNVRHFSATASMAGTWLEPSIDRKKKMMKGRVRVATGGSTKGTTVVWGDYGLRMKDHHRRISAKQLQVAENTIKARLRGQKYRLYKRICCNVGVYVSGNEMRMGKGKGSFDHWAARLAVNQIAFELKGLVHEQVVKDAFRLAGNKLPGEWQFVKKDEPPIVGITKLGKKSHGETTLADIMKPRRKFPAETVSPAAPSTEASQSPPQP